MALLFLDGFDKYGPAKTLAVGDVIRVQGPATADATLANFYCTLVGQ